MKNLAISIGVGVALALAPAPAGVTAKAWNLLAIFTGTIVGIITTPLPLGAVAVLGLGVSMLTKTLTFAEAFSAFANEIPWLIAIAYWLAGGFIKSGLGNRIAYSMVSAFGKTTLGLTYSLVFGEALLSPAIPSVAARAGGIFFPLAKALCLACGSDPDKGTQRKMGAYVMKTCFQTTCVSSAMFITAMAANPLAVNLAAAEGIAISWGTWALAGLVPGLICLTTVPLILYALYPPGKRHDGLCAWGCWRSVVVVFVGCCCHGLCFSRNKNTNTTHHTKKPINQTKNQQKQRPRTPPTPPRPRAASSPSSAP
jgi:anion transporter